MKVLNNPDLSKMSTLKMGGHARAAYYAQDYNDLEYLAEKWPELGPEVLVLGRGSNILFRDGSRDLTLILWDRKEAPAVVEDGADRVKVLADAGMGLPALLRWCAGAGLKGLESLAGIPGKVGGALAMNAGSYGIETLDQVQRMTVWTPESGIADVHRGEFEAGYRSLKLEKLSAPFVIIKALFVLDREDPAKIRKTMREIYLRKKSSQPVTESTAGCVFKNPPGQPAAGILLEEAGLRGKSAGRVCFSSRHSNFLVNKGGASSTEALELISLARKEVAARFGVNLELEVKVV